MKKMIRRRSSTPHRRHDAASYDQVGCLPSDRIFMQVSPNKGAMTDPRQVDTWFKEFEPHLQEDMDYPWWLKVLPLTEGEDEVTDENAKKLARRLAASWRWIKQLRRPMFCPPYTYYFEHRPIPR